MLSVKQCTLEEVMYAIGSGEIFKDNVQYYILATHSKQMIPVSTVPIGHLKGWATGNDAAFIMVEDASN